MALAIDDSIAPSELEGTRLAEGMTAEQLEVLVQSLETHIFEDGDQIVESHAREKSYSLMVITGGTASVLGSFDQEVGQLKQGSLIGEMSFLDGRPRSASVVSVGGTRCAVLHHRQWDGLAESRPDIALRVMVNLSMELCDKMRRSSRLIDALSIASV